MARVRAEFDHMLGEGGLSDIDNVFKNSLTIDSCSELDFLGHVIQEALRTNPIAPVCTALSFDKDTKVGNLKVKANETLTINIWGLHHNGNYW